MHKLIALLVGLLMIAVNAFAAVNVNTANEKELQMLTGIGPAKAKAIIDYRTKNGEFKTVDDLIKVPGIGPAVLGKMKSDVTLTGPTAAKPAAGDAARPAATSAAAPAAAAAKPTAAGGSTVATPVPAPAAKTEPAKPAAPATPTAASAPAAPPAAKPMAPATPAAASAPAAPAAAKPVTPATPAAANAPAA
ncbi:helix-hairpin-helix domain-containing protein, partial [Accumulibacter sp.]